MKHTDTVQIRGLLAHIIDQLNNIEDDLKTIKKKVVGTSGRKRKDLTGQKFGKYTVLRRGEDRGTNRRLRTTWICQCDCGNIRTVLTCNLTTGTSASCGCTRIIGQTKHGHTKRGNKSATYSSYNCMRTRCEVETHSAYCYYGGRGITVCERWMDFNNFLEDMGERPDGCELHRIDPDGNYEPDNCEWKDVFDHRSDHHRKDK